MMEKVAAALILAWLLTATAASAVQVAPGDAAPGDATSPDAASRDAASGGAAPGDPGARALKGDGVFKAFHGKAGVNRVVDDLIVRVQADPRITDIFKASDFKRLKIQLSDQICYILGGPCVYGGKGMKEAHKDMGLQDADLNALVEDLQAAMDREGVPFRAQNQLLAKLAPMRRVVVER